MEKMICPHCERKLHSINAWHYCKKIEIDELFIDKLDEVVLAFDTILQQVSSWENVEISATKNCVVFVKNKTFLVLKPMKKCLEAKFYSNNMFDDEALHKCSIWNSKYEGIMRFENERQITKAFFENVQKSYLIS